MTAEPRAEIRFGSSGDSLYLAIDGEATFVACPAADRLVTDYLAANQESATILLDLASAKWVDSTFAGWLLQVRAKVGGRVNGSISLAGCSDACRKSFEQLGMTLLIDECQVPQPENMTTLACGDGGLSKRALAELMARAHEELASLDEAHRQVFGPIAAALRKELDAGS